jgi:uncharacterized protein YfaQ (DUF2300 family)
LLAPPEQLFLQSRIYQTGATIYSALQAQQRAQTNKEQIMNSRLFSAFSRRALLAMVATVSASAALLSQPATASIQPNFDAPAATQAGRFDPYTQGADRQADTYGYLSWKNDRFDPYSQGADRQADTYGYLSWNGDASYPNGGAASRA